MGRLIKVEPRSYFLCDVIGSLSTEERLGLERRLLKIIIDKRPYYKSPKRREVVKDAVSDLLDVIIQNGL